MGHVFIKSGREDDLDRLLRMRVLDGGLAAPSPRDERSTPNGLMLIDRIGP
jgi:hypothetical protein